MERREKKREEEFLGTAVDVWKATGIVNNFIWRVSQLLEIRELQVWYFIYTGNMLQTLPRDFKMRNEDNIRNSGEKVINAK